jgi:hypothetical protein
VERRQGWAWAVARRVVVGFTSLAKAGARGMAIFSRSAGIGEGEQTC